MKTATVTYGEDSLTITIPTKCPAATHNLLMKGLASSLKNYQIHADSGAHDSESFDELNVLSKLLNSLIPNESQLRKVYRLSPLLMCMAPLF